MIIKNEWALSHSWIPPRILGREEEIDMLTSIIDESLEYKEPLVVGLIGNEAQGKTLLWKYLDLRLFKKWLNVKPPVYFHYTNAENFNTPYKVLGEILQAIHRPEKPGLSMNYRVNKLTEYLKVEPSYIYLLIDNVEQFNNGTFSQLLRISVQIMQETESLINFFITGNISNLPHYIPSQYQTRKIKLRDYTSNDYVDILQQRLKEALYPGSYEPSILKTMLEIMEREKLNLREVITLLRVAAKNAHNKITPEDLLKAQDQLNYYRVNYKILELSQSELLVLKSILLLKASKRTTRTGSIYKLYKLLAKKQGQKALTERRISSILWDLHQKGLIEVKMTYNGNRGNYKLVSRTLLEPKEFLRIINKIRR